MTTTDVSLLAYVKSLFPFNTDRIQSISREDGKLFVATDDDKRYILKLVELPPIVASVNMGELYIKGRLISVACVISGT